MKPNCILSKALIKARKTTCLFFIAGCLLVPVSGFSQLNLKGKLKDAANNRASDKIDQGIEKGMGAVENGVKSIFKRKTKPKTSPKIQTKNKSRKVTKTVKAGNRNRPWHPFNLIPITILCPAIKFSF